MALRGGVSALWLGLLATPAAAAASRPPRQTVSVSPASSPIRVDGVLDEAAWTSAAVVPLRYEWQPGDNTTPRESTDCLLTYDRARLYVAFRARDREPSAIRAHLADRDVAFQDDTVGFMLDTFDDERRAFQFRVNPLGVQMDASNSDVDGSEDWSWDAIWDSAGTLGPDGFVVEIAVPFTSLRFPRRTDAQTWGFLAMRDLPRSLRYRMRSSWTDRGQACVVCQFDKVAGFTGLKPGLDLELDPAVITARTDRRAGFPAGPLDAGGVDVDPGLSVRWGLTPNLTLNGAANPDFSQVEADVAQLDVNTRFALFFPEKRPFFLEGADFFSTPIDAVFTRTVADPDVGVKLSGKEGVHAIAAFVSRDAITNLLFPANQGSTVDSLDRASTAGVVRLRRDVARTSTVGVLGTAREAGDYHNRVAGIDGLIRFTGADRLRFQYLRSSTRYPDEVARDQGQPIGGFGGYAGGASYEHQARNWYWRGELEAFSPGFRADGGFVPRVDTVELGGGVERTLWGGERRWFTRIHLGAYADRTVDFEGKLTDSGFDFPITYLGPRQIQVSYNPAPNREYFDGVVYDNFRHNFSFEIRPTGSVFVSLRGTVGDTIDFANARPAEMVDLRPVLEFNLARRVSGSLNHRHQTLDVAGGRLFTAKLSQARVVLHFDRRTFVRAILQYTDVDRVAALYLEPVAPRTRRLFSQLLFSFKLNPQTVVLAGYSDNQLGERGIDLTRTDRTFFLKIGYAWVL